MANSNEITAKIIIRGGTTAEWESKNPILDMREVGAESCTDGIVRMKIGNGTTAWNDLPYIASEKLSELIGDSTHRTVTDAEKAAWTAKQNALTFDTAPTEGSANPVTSGGVKTAIAAIEEQLDGITGDGVVTGVKGSAETEYRKGSVNITAANIGLGNVDNTADADKPISTAMQTALDAKANANALDNYYTKTQVDTTVETLEGQISAIPKFAVSVVDELPATGAAATIYLVKTSESETGNLYTEYIYVDGKFEKLGTQTLDLSNYATQSWVNTQINGLSAVAKSGKLSDATEDSTHQTVTAAQKTEWSGKQDALTFDSTPTAGSTNPVTSGGVKSAIDSAVEATEAKIINKSTDLTDSASLVRYTDTIVINGGNV